MKTILFLFLSVSLSVAQTKSKTVASQAKTILTAISKTSPSDAVFRAVLSSYVSPKSEPGLVFSLSATAPVNNRFSYQAGDYGYLGAGDEFDLPVLAGGVLRFGGGRYLESNAPVSVANFTVWLSLRRAGLPGKSGVLFSIGNQIGVSIDEGSKVVSVFFPTATGEPRGFTIEGQELPGKIGVVCFRFGDGRAVVTINGTDYLTQTLSSFAPNVIGLFRVGGGSLALEVGAMAVYDRYLSDEEIRKLEITLK